MDTHAAEVTRSSGSITQNEMTFDFDGLIQLLAGHLYSEKKVFIRELIQNAHDAIQRRAVKDPEFDRDQGRIDILTDLATEPGRIIFRDNGLGMTWEDLEDFLSTIGKSGTLAASGDAPEVIGQFGIGFLSGFVVGSRVEVRTRYWESPPNEGCLWENAGNKDYTIKAFPREQIGTEVTVHLAGAEDRGLLHDDAVKQVIRDYADMLRIPIHVNDPQHDGPSANTRVMPWERTGVTKDELRLDSIVYLEKTVPDSVLEVIPLRADDDSDIHVEGLLYITRTRVIGRDAPRTVRVFLKRMFLCEDAKEVLPPWASFVNGILNTRDLSPNAARDNFTLDASFNRLQDRLGDIIVEHFESLKESDPQRLSEILAYHDLSIKAACGYYQPFYEKFSHLLEWRINSKSPAAGDGSRPAGRRVVIPGELASHAWATLPDILAAIPDPPDGSPKRMTCFTTTSAANQYFEMADAAGTTVVDASYGFESELIKAWADHHKNECSLVYVDREDDPNVFREIDASRDSDVRQLAQIMSVYIRPGGTGRVRVEARRFEPDTLPAVLKDSDAGRGARKAREILNDPNMPSDMRTMAEEMLLLSRNADMRLNINASNPLIRTLAALVAADPDDDDLLDLMKGVYNDAILYNQEMMTPSNARLFHEQFQRLMTRSLEFVRQKSDLRKQQEEVDRQRRRRKLSVSRRHLVAFLMTPFAAEFDQPRSALRNVVEDRLGCELRTADQKTFEDFIRGNVQAHLDDADFYVADVTGANPNVMLELGAALYGQSDAPTLLVSGVAAEGDKPDLPADLDGHIAGLYVTGHSLKKMTDALEDQFRNHIRLNALLDREGHEKFISPESLREFSRDLLKGKGVYERLSEKLPTTSAWQSVCERDLEDLLGSESDLAAALIKRTLDALS